MQKELCVPNIDRNELQHCRGALSVVLSRVNTCLLFDKCDIPDAKDAFSALLAITCDRESALKLHSTLGSLRWPGSYGSSPWEELFSVLHSAVHGYAPSKNFGRLSRILHQDLIERIALPAAVNRLNLNEVGRKKRYSRLLEAMRQGALLTHGEADSALRMLLNACPGERAKTFASCEAVDHFGGNLRVVHQARRWRHLFRDQILSASKINQPQVVAFVREPAQSTAC